MKRLIITAMFLAGGLALAQEDELKQSEGPIEEMQIRLAGSKLAHGDFAALLRRYSAIKSKPDASQLVADLKVEASFRDTDSSRPIGFLAEF